MVKEFNSLEEIQKYYDKKTNTYIFKEDGEYIDLVIFNFDLSITSNINARDISACDINAYDISAWNINARDISACNINACDIKARNIQADYITYYAVCFAYIDIKCKSIKGIRLNSKHFVLDGQIEIEEGLK